MNSKAPAADCSSSTMDKHSALGRHQCELCMQGCTQMQLRMVTAQARAAIGHVLQLARPSGPVLDFISQSFQTAGKQSESRQETSFVALPALLIHPCSLALGRRCRCCTCSAFCAYDGTRCVDRVAERRCARQALRAPASRRQVPRLLIGSFSWSTDRVLRLRPQIATVAS